MRCRFCGQVADLIVIMTYVWGERLEQPVCSSCWEQGRDNPAWLGFRRDREVTVKKIEYAGVEQWAARGYAK